MYILNCKCVYVDKDADLRSYRRGKELSSRFPISFAPENMPSDKVLYTFDKKPAAAEALFSSGLATTIGSFRIGENAISIN